MTTAERSPESVIAGYFDAINSEQYDRLPGLFAEDGTYATPGARIRTGTEIPTFFGKLFAAWTEHLDTPTYTLHDAERAAVWVRFTGVSLDGRELGFDAVDLFTFTGDHRIATLTTLYDLDAVRTLLAGPA